MANYTLLEKKLEFLREKKQVLLQGKKTMLKKELEFAQKIYADQEYTKILENSALQDKIKKIILEQGPFTGSEIDVFVQENLNHPALEEIFNDFKGNKDIINVMKKCGIRIIQKIMPHLIYLEFFGVNEKLNEQKSHKVMELEQKINACQDEIKKIILSITL